MSFPIISKSIKDAKEKEKIALYTAIVEEINAVLIKNNLTAEEAELLLQTLSLQIVKKAKQSFKL